MFIDHIDLADQAGVLVRTAGAVLLVITIIRYLDHAKPVCHKLILFNPWGIFTDWVDPYSKVNVPVIGPGTRFTTWPAAIRNLWSARPAVHEGYTKV